MKTCRLLLGIWIILFAMEGYGDIVAPESVKLGEKLIVASDSDADMYIWSIPRSIEFEAVDGNKKIYCWGLEGKYDFELTTIIVDWEKKIFIQSPLQRVTVVIGDPGPGPDPDPEPDLTGLALDVYKWGMGVEKNNRVYANSLGINYTSIAKRLLDMELTIENALNELRKLNNKVLDTRAKKDAWAVFGSRLQERMESRWPMEKKVFVGFLRDVGVGFSYVK